MHRLRKVLWRMQTTGNSKTTMALSPDRSALALMPVADARIFLGLRAALLLKGRCSREALIP